MKIIDEYLNSLYKNDKSKEVGELKEELREHLISSANEFMSNGDNKETSQHKAINQFDGGTEMLVELHKNLKEAKITNEKLTKKTINIFRNISIISLLLTLLLSLHSYKTFDNYDWVEYRIRAYLTDMFVEKDLYNPNTYDLYNAKSYEDELDKLLKTDDFNNGLKQLLKDRDFKHVRFVEVSTNPHEKPAYRYSDGSNQNKKLTRYGDFVFLAESKNKDGVYIPNSKEHKVFFKVGLDYKPILRNTAISSVIPPIGIISFIVYLVLTIKFRLKNRVVYS